ncbi:DUF2201 family putative metallopeptidase [Arachnia propionica]|uniref:Uncharacterized protein n=1 Tax=Arachnia propionica TaxID=1750 RepID=A0A3P1WYI4_9ACTN|nr:VWA-like domain-containing protein [Arachnia propionica]RRD49473.1 hypothetical protein EII35_08385 [Arachnia propionica]
MSRTKSRITPAQQAWEDGVRLAGQHPVFGHLLDRISLHRREGGYHPERGHLKVAREHALHIHPKRLATPEEWAFVLARASLYYAMELWRPDRGDWVAWSAACDVVTTRFVTGLKFGRTPEGMQLPADLPQWDEQRWYREFTTQGIPGWAATLSLAGPDVPSMESPSGWIRWWQEPTWLSWPKVFAEGIAESVTQAVEMAAGLRETFGHGGLRERPDKLSATTLRARDWFTSSFPLLASMVASFTFVENVEICQREKVMIAAVDEELGTIYLNPAAGLGVEQTKFVIAHEVLHVALRHHSRRAGRDPFLWNAACDYVINDWLIQMQVGEAPDHGLLFDEELRGLSAEEVYDRIVTDIRLKRKLMTLAGKQGDMLERPLMEGTPWFTDLDAFCRDQLGKGLMLHQQQERGFLPLGLVEEIKALLQPPIPWEVKLAQWFDRHFPAVETHRTWKRLSRRQSSSPDIPRPHREPDFVDGRTFGVVLDTSGSMERNTLAKALGSIASYAEAKEVPYVRVICCDAAAYDLGWLAPGDIAGRVQIKGRGGTVLAPGVRKLVEDPDFPKNGPILIITDGDCDVFTVPRDHAFLVPKGCQLPFRPKGDLFEMS